MSRVRVGIALDDRELVACRLDGASDVHRIDLEAGPAAPARATILGALIELRTRLESGAGTPLGDDPVVGVALLGPIAQFRRIELPPLADDEAEALLLRDAPRYFPGGAFRRVVAIQPRSDRSEAVRAVAAPSMLLESLVDAAAEAGFRVDRITAGWQAWAASGSPDARIAIARRGELQLLTVQGGRPAELRRAPLGEVDMWTALAPGGDVVLIGEGSDLETARAGLEQAGIHVRVPASGSDAAALAARGALDADVVLVPERLRDRRREQGRRRGVRLLVGAAVLAVVAVVLHDIGLRRELADARSARAEIAAEVAPLLTMRDSLMALNDEVRAVREVSQRSHDWTTALAELALLLPRETWLTSLTGAEGVLEFEAAGERAGSAIDALRAARSLSNVRLEGLVERELEDGETVVERFRLGAQVRLRRLDEPAATGGVPR